jgi:16S rRNA (cytosine967-C5)-methyltransferase
MLRSLDDARRHPDSFLKLYYFMPLLLTSNTHHALFPNLLQAVVECLSDIFGRGQLAERIVEQKLKSNRKWGARDRALIAKLTFDTVRWYRLLCDVVGFTPQSENEWVQLVGVLCVLQDIPLPRHEALAHLNKDDIKKRFLTIDKNNTAVVESIPDWLNEVGSAQLKDQWPVVIKALNEQTPMVLRVNTLKITVDELQDLLASEDCDTDIIAQTPDALLVVNRKNVLSTQAFKDGLFELQDAASQQAAILLDVKPNMTVVDACAGAGGKTLHIATLMNNTGHITALDINAKKLAELNNRAYRNGVHIINTEIIDDEVIARYQQQADRVLLDVPCSGLGVLRRHPDTKWKLTPEFLDEVMQTQATLLNEYSHFCKVGGKLLYVTCSILPSENEQQVEKFIKAKAEQFVLLKEKTLMPQVFGFDGFYMALMERVN